MTAAIRRLVAARAGMLALMLMLAGARPALAEDGGVTILVTSNGWHTGLVVARTDIPAGLVPETTSFAPNVRWFEFGWGSAEYYPLHDPGMLDALRAAAGSAAVMHVAGLTIPVNQMFPAMEVVTLPLTRTQFGRLIAEIDAAFARNGQAVAAPSGPGLYRFSRFYPATGRFTALHTCNTWVAETLQGAGLAVDAAGVERADDVLRQLRR